MILNFPKVHKDQNNRFFISFYINNKRYRLYNGSRIGSSFDPNSFPPIERLNMTKVLASEVYNYLVNGGVLEVYRSNFLICGNLTDKVYIDQALDRKLKGSYSKKYKKLLTSLHSDITGLIADENITFKDLNYILDKYTSSVTYNTMRRHIKVLINEAISLGMTHDPMKNIPSRRAKAKLHKPINDVGKLLEEIKQYSFNLYLCCLMTYGCLLRPHREIRELTWGDFSVDLSYIHLSGERNKSGKNRNVPVPKYIRDVLIKGVNNHNIFTASKKPLNEDYFKTLWARFKQTSNLIEDNQTLYSFRHTGAIDIFKRTGSITKLQKAMGHSNLNVSLTYLRGLEVAELTEEDMPVI